MVNVVIWLESNKYREALSAACAGNGIRIVADEFKNAFDFLKTFDEIDTNIDVLVISNNNLENVDKKSFFDDVCVTEPNLRIVIVFPGYRNQYIEKQISEYKQFGISDVIYEGQGLDATCFSEVVKKGYIYNCDINTYDEKEETSLTVPERKCVTIGVLGLTSGCGVTNMSVSVAEYIAGTEDIAVKAVDFSNTGNMRFAKAKGVTFIVNNKVDTARIISRNKAVVFDFGMPFRISSKGKLINKTDCFSEEKMTVFRSCDLKIIMCFADSWHIGKVKYILGDKIWRREIDNSYLFVFDKLPDVLKSKNPKINIFGRNDKSVARYVAALFAGEGGA